MPVLQLITEQQHLTSRANVQVKQGAIDGIYRIQATTGGEIVFIDLSREEAPF